VELQSPRAPVQLWHRCSNLHLGFYYYYFYYNDDDDDDGCCSLPDNVSRDGEHDVLAALLLANNPVEVPPRGDEGEDPGVGRG